MNESISERVTGGDQRVEFLAGARGVYCQLLGKEKIPESVAEMPIVIHLTPDIVKGVPKMVLETVEDGAERWQRIYWDPKRKSFIFEKVRRGKKREAVASLGDSVKIGLGNLVGERPFLFLHSHLKSCFPSWGDVAELVASPKRPFIFGIAAPDGILLLLQTNMGLRRHWNLQRLLLEDYRLRQRPSVNDLRTIANYLKTQGVAFYRWSPEGNFGDKELVGGITPSRIII